MRTRKYSAPELTFDFTVNSEQLRTMENAILAEGVSCQPYCNCTSFRFASLAIHGPNYGHSCSLATVVFGHLTQGLGLARHPALLRRIQADALHARELVDVVQMLPHTVDQTPAAQHRQ